MAENIEQMQHRHDIEIAELRAMCKHEHVSDWMPSYWAPGHSTGQKVKTCLDCGKLLHIRPTT